MLPVFGSLCRGSCAGRGGPRREGPPGPGGGGGGAVFGSLCRGSCACRGGQRWKAPIGRVGDEGGSISSVHACERCAAIEPPVIDSAGHVDVGAAVAPITVVAFHRVANEGRSLGVA